MTTTINYDEKYDVFYLRPKEFVSSYAEENDNGVVTLRSMLDDTIIGMVIYDFKIRVRSGILQKCQLPLPLDFGNPDIVRILITQ